MTDIERGRIGGGDEDRLPWLEPVEDETPDAGVGAGKLIAAVLVCLIAIGLVIGGIFWLRERGGPAETAQGDGDLIAAPAGDYKVAPSDPGGMNVEGEGDATFAASQGVPVDAAIDISKQPETPVAGNERAPAPVKAVPLPPSTASGPAAALKPDLAKPAAPVTKPATPVSAPTPKPAPAKPVEVAKKPVPPKPAAATATGPAVQLGAFGSEAKAQSAWSDLASRFPTLRSMSHSVSLAEVNGKKLYRLRASAGNAGKASAVCKALTSAKEACNVIG